MPDNRHVGIAIAGAHPLIIFAEGIVQHPVQVVFYTPVRPHDLPQTFGVGGIHAADEVTGFPGGFALTFADGGDGNDAGELRPMGVVIL